MSFIEEVSRVFVSIRSIYLRSWRFLFGLVYENPSVFSFCIGENREEGGGEGGVYSVEGKKGSFTNAEGKGDFQGREGGGWRFHVKKVEFSPWKRGGTQLREKRKKDIYWRKKFRRHSSQLD